MTDRKALAASADEQIRLLLEEIASVARAGVDWIQIREKDLPGLVLCELVREALRRVPAKCRIIVNDRLDVAYAAGAAGVHLGGQSISVVDARQFLRKRNLSGDFSIGASVHSVEAARIAQESGANYIIFGPVFATPSKAKYGEPQGLERLVDVCRRTRLPVIAIGGITVEQAGECIRAGAAGIAAIRLFQETEDPESLVKQLRKT